MNHQKELEKKKYRNWVRGGLAYKYLKEGIEGFADEVVQQEHNRILSDVVHTSGLTCSQCCHGNLRPLHKCENDPVNGRNKCPWRQSNCNCLYPKKKKCPKQVCDRIMEDVLKGHGSTPPTPNWKNTDIQKWCSAPWEIAKCFINAPGYSDKTKAADIDTPGLLHIFINNINLQSHFSESLNRSDIFKKTLQRRNELFHSPSMEMEDSKLDKCIDEIIAILEDEKELKARHDSQQAVLKLKQLKHESFIITTHNEAEVCRDALASITNKSEELKQTIQDAKDDFRRKQREAVEAIDDKANECRDVVVSLTNQSGAELKHTIQDAKDDIRLKQTGAKEAIDDKANECRDTLVSITNQSAAELKKTIQDAKDDIGRKQTEAAEVTESNVKECKDAVANVTNKSVELKKTIQDAKAGIGKEQVEAIEAIKDKTQKSLQQIGRHTDILYERVRRLEIDSSSSKQRLTVLEGKVDDLDLIRKKHHRQLDYVEGKQVLQKKLVELYQNYYVNTSSSPLKLQESNINIQEVYVAPEMVVEEEPVKSETASVHNAPSKPNIRPVTGYRELFQTNGQKHKHVYIVGDVGTGKSIFSKMMIQNWCSAVTKDNSHDRSKDTSKSYVKYENDNDDFSAVKDENINEMRNYDFIFFVPLQRMSGLSDVTEMIKAILTNADLASRDFIDRIFEQESERCLIVADGLDEWTPPKRASVLQHVSYGLPNRDRAKHATIVTLSRPSAKGILNMRSSECDQKVELLGINVNSMVYFIKTYLSKLNKTGLSHWGFMKKIKSSKLDHLEKTPLLLQQLVWLYGTGTELGKSISETYSHLVNTMLGWSQNKDEGDDLEGDQICDTEQDKDMILPRLLRIFPKCEEHKRFLLPLARVAFEALTSEIGSRTFGRLYLRQKGVSKDAIAALIKFGILVESNCFNPTLESTQLEFIHISYLEFFAAVYISSHFNEKKPSSLSNTILRSLFQKCKSAADVLQLSNVLRMICGLSPFLISEISKLVSDIANGDKNMIIYRHSLGKYRYRYRYDHVSDQIQRLILKCLYECNSDYQEMVTLRDVIIDRYTKMSCLQRVIPENVLSLQAAHISDVAVWRWIARLTRLRYMYIGDSTLPHSEKDLLSSIIEDAPLKCLSLNSVVCKSPGYHYHNIDLSKHDQLQKLELTGCDQVKITNINTNHLEMLHLNYLNISNINCLLNASSLTELEIRYDYGEYNKQVNYVVHTLHKLRKLKLNVLLIDESALTVTPEMRNLKHIELDDCIRSLQTWRTFVDSLLTLQQSVQVDCRGSYSGEDELSYVRRNTIMFEVMNDDTRNFSFRTNCILGFSSLKSENI